MNVLETKTQKWQNASIHECDDTTKKVIKPSCPSFFFIALHYNVWWTFAFFAMRTQVILLTLTLIRLMPSLMQQKLTPFLPMHLMGLDKCEAYMSIDIAKVLGEQKGHWDFKSPFCSIATQRLGPRMPWWIPEVNPHTHPTLVSTLKSTKRWLEESNKHSQIVFIDCSLFPIG
jgi:hypothetical protein